MKVISGSRRDGFFQRILLFVLVLFLILAVVGWFVARSGRFRTMMEEQLMHRTGVPVRIADSYIGWPYVLVLRGVASPDDFAPAKIQIRELRLGRGLRHSSVQIRGARIGFVPDAMESATHTVSSGLLRMARLREAGAIDIMRATETLQAGWRIQLDDVDFVWLHPDGSIDASVAQVHFMMAPVQLPSEDMTYYAFRFPGMAHHAMGSMQDLDWRWLTRGGDHYVEILRKGEAPEVLFDNEAMPEER